MAERKGERSGMEEEKKEEDESFSTLFSPQLSDISIRHSYTINLTFDLISSPSHP